jgi:HSP20 family protein
LEKDGAYRAEVTLPGFEAKDIEVTVTPTEIIVHAATKEQKQSEKESVLWAEFGSNDVYRRFGLPNPISVDKVTANLENGILRVNAPEIPKPKAVPATA